MEYQSPQPMTTRIRPVRMCQGQVRRCFLVTVNLAHGGEQKAGPALWAGPAATSVAPGPAWVYSISFSQSVFLNHLVWMRS